MEIFTEGVNRAQVFVVLLRIVEARRRKLHLLERRLGVQGISTPSRGFGDSILQQSVREIDR